MDLDLLSRVLFPRPPSSYAPDSFPGELLWVPRTLNPQTAKPEDCVPLCLLQCPLATSIVMYFHSNFEDIGRAYNFCSGLRRALQVHVLIVEYPGYGICPGIRCDESSAAECAQVALYFVREVLRCPKQSIILMGRSIGTGLATLLAGQSRYGGLVLICPFLSIKDLVRGYIGPAASLLGERLPNKEHITKVRSPCLFLHGQNDDIIPVSHCQHLYELCQCRKLFVSPEKMDHNVNLLLHPSFLIDPMREFILTANAEDKLAFNVPMWAFDKQMCPQFKISAQQNDSSRRTTCWTPSAQDDQNCMGTCTACESFSAQGEAVETHKKTTNKVFEENLAKAVGETFSAKRENEAGRVLKTKVLQPIFILENEVFSL